MPTLRITPHGCSDSVYSNTEGKEPSLMSSLSNLVPAPDSPDEWVPRPAAVLLDTLTTPVTCQLVVGDFLYGMQNDPAGSGYDTPFAFNLLSSTALSISGVTTGSAGNCPNSLSAGAWQPPHMDSVGAYILCTHAGFQGEASIALVTKYIVLSTTGQNTWTVPADWNAGENSIQAIGGGGEIAHLLLLGPDDRSHPALGLVTGFLHET